jgi:hypothetical protein
MSNYAKLGTLLLRCFGVVMIAYSAPMILWGVLKLGAGGRVASDGVNSTASVVFSWGIYLLAGILLVVFARPLGHLASRGLDSSSSGAAAA